MVATHCVSQDEKALQSTPNVGTTQQPLSSKGTWTEDHSSEIAVGLIVSLVVAAIVWLAGRPAAWWSRRQDNEAARKAISAEIDSNLVQLRGIWDSLTRPLGSLAFDPCFEEEIGGLRLTRMDPTRWRRSAWEDRPLQAAAALSPEMFRVVQEFYDKLARLEVVKGSLGRPVETLKPCWRLSSDGKRAWAEYEEITERLLENGNPLAAPINHKQEP